MLKWIGLLLVLCLYGCAQTSSQTESSQGVLQERLSCKVLMVFDGDTVACDLNENAQIEKPKEHIRFLGIDAPETRFSKRKNSPEAQDEPYAIEALEYVKQHTQGKTVYLAFDQEREDYYGRTLAFVYLSPEDTVSLNEMLIRNGLASSFFISPNLMLKNRFEQAEVEARQDRKNLWQPL